MSPSSGARRPRPLALRLLALGLVLTACASTDEVGEAETRLREASLRAAEVLARESAPAWRSLGDEGFEALAIDQMRQGQDQAGGPPLAFRALRTVPYGEGALVCGELTLADAAPQPPWLRFVGGALPGDVWTEYSTDWITRAANAAILSACG